MEELNFATAIIDPSHQSQAKHGKRRRTNDEDQMCTCRCKQIESSVQRALLIV